MNSNLYSSAQGIVPFPKELRQYLKKMYAKFQNVDENTDGYKRNLELQNQKTIDYKQLKRIKNFFDSFKGKQNDPEFVLNGGFQMKNWVNDELRKMREYGHLTSKNKMDAGMQNQFIDPHEKKDFTNVRNSQKHSSTVQKYDAAVTESLKRINQIISKL